MGVFANLEISNIDLDLENPRIKRFLEKYGETPSAEQIALALGGGLTREEGQTGPTFQSLKESIRTHGGIFQPIIVNKKGERYIVVEGNTRVAIYKEFEEEGVSGNWLTIPAIVHEGLSLGGIDAIRLQAHLVGPRDWDAYSKAKYLNHLRNCDHLTMSQIIDYCGGKKKEVEEYIAAYIDMERYYRPILDANSVFDTTRFSAFVEVQRPNVRKAIVDAGFGLSDFSQWVHDQLIYPLNTVRQLPQILINPEAKKIFLKDGAREAMKVLNVDNDASLKKASVESLARELYNKISAMQMDEFKDMKKDLGKKKVVALFSLEEELSDTCKMLRSED